MEYFISIFFASKKEREKERKRDIRKGFFFFFQLQLPFSCKFSLQVCYNNKLPICCFCVTCLHTQIDATYQLQSLGTYLPTQSALYFLHCRSDGVLINPTVYLPSSHLRCCCSIVVSTSCFVLIIIEHDCHVLIVHAPQNTHQPLLTHLLTHQQQQQTVMILYVLKWQTTSTRNKYLTTFSQMYTVSDQPRRCTLIFIFTKQFCRIFVERF